jgi:hypothetical protein
VACGAGPLMARGNACIEGQAFSGGVLRRSGVHRDLEAGVHRKAWPQKDRPLRGARFRQKGQDPSKCRGAGGRLAAWGHFWRGEMRSKGVAR